MSSWLHDPGDTAGYADRDDYERLREQEFQEHLEAKAEVEASRHRVDFKSPPRIVEDQIGWEQLRRAKLAPCRICNYTWLPQLHHLVSRSLGGDDVPDNLVPLCRDCHQAVEEHDPASLQVLGRSLTHREIAYVSCKKGVDYLERRYWLKVPA